MSQKVQNSAIAALANGGTERTVLTSSAGCFAIEAVGVRVDRGGVPVLRDINISIAQGETIAVIGPNGAGKSTLLKCLAGAVRPNGGEVRWFGNSVARSPAVRRRIGFVGHECGMYMELTALENLMFAGRMHNVERPGERAAILLAAAGLEPAAHRSTGKLSQGMQRRLTIARALVHEPQLILLDEPCASLDAGGRHWLDQLFQRWRSTGRIVCFASHDVDQSRRLADRIVWLDAGHIVGVEPTTCLPAYSRWSA